MDKDANLLEIMGAIQDALNSFGDQTVDIIRQNLASTGTNASNETSKSLKSTLVEPNRLQVTGKPYIYVVETGRKPGKISKKMVSNILKWVETGKPSFSGDKVSFAWAITKKIGKEGSALFRAGGRKDIITPAISEQRINRLTSEIAGISLDLLFKSIEDGKRR